MRQFKYDTFRMLTRCLDRWEEYNFLDLGASIGYTAQRAVMDFPLSRVWALEPEPASFAKLQERIAPLKRVRAFNIAASDTAGSHDFHVNKLAASSSLLPASQLGNDYYVEWYQEAQVRKVETVRLDQWMPTVGLDRVDVLKIDVQGMELQVLRTLEKQLAKNILAIDCEAQFVPEYEGASTFLDIACLLRDHGFMLHQVHNMWACGAEMQTTCMDGLWLKQDLFHRLRATPAPLLDPGPAGILQRAMKRMNQLGMKRIALYGAGAFTREALKTPTDSPLQIIGIADDDQSLHGGAIAGIPITSLQDVAGNSPDALVLCSEARERFLFENTSEYRRNGLTVVPLIRYYQELDGSHPLRSGTPVSARVA